MVDVFISYKREDEARVRPLRDALVTNAISVWWDRDIPGGEAWRSQIHDALEEAKCVIVVWSHLSVAVEGSFVRDEAAHAAARKVLLPVRIDPVAPPLGFGELQTLDLTGWNGRTSDPRFLDVLAVVRARKEQRPLPVPRWPLLKRRRVLAWVTGGFVPLLTALAMSPGAQRVVCKVPGLHTVCAATGIGRAPSGQEKQVWEAALRRGDGEGLRGYLASYPTGAFVEECEARLAACRIQQDVGWGPEIQVKELPQVIIQSADPSPSEEAARADALRRGAIDARRQICAGYDRKNIFYLVDASSKAELWSCSQRDQGVSCGYDGKALCRVRTKQVVKREVCR